MSDLSDFTLFDPKFSILTCLHQLYDACLQISGITSNYKTLSIICVKPRQRNSGVHRCQILCRIQFDRSRHRKLPQFRGLHGFDKVDRCLFRPDIFEPPPKKWKNQKMESATSYFCIYILRSYRDQDQNIFEPKLPSGFSTYLKKYNPQGILNRRRNGRVWSV